MIEKVLGVLLWGESPLPAPLRWQLHARPPYRHAAGADQVQEVEVQVVPRVALQEDRVVLGPPAVFV